MSAGGTNPSRIMDKIALNVGKLVGIGFSVSAYARGGGTGTLTVPSGHGLIAGDIVLVRGVSVSAFNGYWTLTSVTETTISFALGGSTVSGSTTGMISKRIGQGKRRFSAAENFEQSVLAQVAESNGYFAFKSTARRGGNQTQVGTFSIAGILLINLPSNTTSDCNSVIDLCEAVLTALGLESNFSSIGRPQSVEYVETEDPRAIDEIAIYEFSATYECGILCASTIT